MRKFALAVVLGILLIGCGSSGGVDENKTVAQIVEEVKQMDMAQIQSKIEQYTDAIEAKKTELEPLITELKKIPITQMLGEDAKKIKADMEEIKSSITTLKQKMDVYVNALKSLQSK